MDRERCVAWRERRSLDACMEGKCEYKSLRAMIAVTPNVIRPFNFSSQRKISTLIFFQSFYSKVANVSVRLLFCGDAKMAASVRWSSFSDAFGGVVYDLIQ